MDIVAVDWSGAVLGAATRIWLAHVVDGELVDLHNGRSRAQVVADLVALRDRCPEGLVAGLDFSFSFPEWFLRERQCATVDELWTMVAREGERWLADCAPPFWGRPGRPRPAEYEPLRRAERSISVGGISPKSTFQIGGAGAVGTGSIRGMPHLAELRRAGFTVWPFDAASAWTVLEIYPRLLTGPVRKSEPAQRAHYLRNVPWRIPARFARAMLASDDAFDAGISALVMHDHRDDLAALQRSDDPVTLVEGDVWRPSKITP